MDRIISEHLNQIFTLSSPNAVQQHLKLFLEQSLSPSFEAMVILQKRTEETYQTIYSNEPVFEGLSWSRCNLFNRLKMSGSLYLKLGITEMEFSLQSKEVNDKSQHLLFFYHFVGNEEYILFFTSSSVVVQTFFDTSPNSVLMRIALLRIIELLGHQNQISHYQALFEQASSQVDLFFDLSSEWLWRTNTFHEFIHIDDYGRNTSIYTNMFIGETLWSMTSDDEAEHLKKWSQLMSLMDRNKEFINFEFETSSGLWFSISGKPQFSKQEGFIGYLGIAKDITYNKERENALREAKLKAERASNAKSHFLGLMSHEIRTPMNAILGVIEMLKESPLNDSQSKWLSVASGSAALLKGLLNDILDYSKIETGQITLVNDTFDLHALVISISEQFKLTNTNSAISFETMIGQSCPKMVKGDGTRVSQILFNILGNAFKYTESGQISFDVDYLNGQFTFTITDTGIGIEPSQINSLLQPKPNSTLQSETLSPKQGLGMGLSITKTLVGLMNGTIECDSILGKMTRFKITIPMLIQQVVENDLAEPEQTKIKPLSILVAEDNIPNQMLVRAFLEKAGHQCEIANTGAEALNKLTVNQYDIVLMDVMMPVMDGLEATSKIRKDMCLNLPIWGLTANATKEDITACLEVGMNRVLTKPISYHALINALQEDEQLVRRS